MTSQPSNVDLFRTYVTRLEKESDFMAFVLRKYQLQEGISDGDLAQRLTASPEAMLRLAMCRRPSDHDVEYVQKVRQISVFASVNEFQLFSILRQVENLDTLQNVDEDAQFLSAARDRETDTQEDE